MERPLETSCNSTIQDRNGESPYPRDWARGIARIAAEYKDGIVPIDISCDDAFRQLVTRRAAFEQISVLSVRLMEALPAATSEAAIRALADHIAEASTAIRIAAAELSLDYSRIQTDDALEHLDCALRILYGQGEAIIP